MSFSEVVIKRLALFFRAWAQKKNLLTEKRVLKVAHEIIGAQKYCVINSYGEAAITSRVLQPFTPDTDVNIWFGTSPSSRKVAELKRNNKATLTYLDSKKGAAVALEGQFTIVETLAERKKYFKPMWWAFFPEGPEGNDFICLRFQPSAIEVWDANRGITPEPFGLLSARIEKSVSGWVLKAPRT